MSASLPSKLDVSRLILMISPESKSIAFEYESISEKDESLLVRLRPISAEDSAFIEHLRSDRSKPIGIAFGYTGMFARLEREEREISGSDQKWTLNLSQVYAGPTASTMEMGFASLSVAELARMRARRLLLNEALVHSYPPGDLNAQTLEMFVQGFDVPVRIVQSPIPSLYQHHQDDPILFSAMAKLFCVFLLVVSGTVKTIERLVIEVAGPGRVRVDFAGVRARTYVNMEAERIEFGGYCRLEK